MIFILQCIICANQNQLDSALLALKSIQKIIKFDSNLFLVHIYGWFANDSLYQRFESHVQKTQNVSLIRNGINVGKAFILHHLEFPKETEYLLYMDGDLQIQNVPFFHQRLTHIQNKTNSVIILNQLDDNRHHRAVYSYPKQISGHGDIMETIYCPPNGIGLAGGAFFTSKSIFNQCIYPMVGLHHIDDVIWIKILIANDYTVILSKDLCVKHPINPDQKYTQWKLSHRKSCLDRPFQWEIYLKEIGNSHLFWA